MKSQKGHRSWAGFACNRSLDFLANFLARVKGAPPLARVEVDGVDLVASFTVRHQSDGQWYYNAVALHDAKEKAQDSYGRPDQQAGSSVAPLAGLGEFSRKSLARVNPEAVSKVVDSATGEPLVVYHGTGKDFTEFQEGKRQSQYGGGLYFGRDPKVASSFASPLRGPAPNVMPVYLRTS